MTHIKVSLTVNPSVAWCVCAIHLPKKWNVTGEWQKFEKSTVYTVTHTALRWDLIKWKHLWGCTKAIKVPLRRERTTKLRLIINSICTNKLSFWGVRETEQDFGYRPYMISILMISNTTCDFWTLLCATFTQSNVVMCDSVVNCVCVYYVL